MGKVSDDKLQLVKKLYYKDGYSMRRIAEFLHISADAVVYFMRHHELKRRSFQEEQELRFKNKKPSFKRIVLTHRLRELYAMGTMLYWAEGYKGGKNGKNYTIDFANSDPKMISVFLNFLREVYRVDEKKLRVYLYCYKDQKTSYLIKYWSRITKVPIKNFPKPYVRDDFSRHGRKMRYGLVHIRYGDKKLLLEILKSIEYYCRKHAPVV